MFVFFFVEQAIFFAKDMGRFLLREFIGYGFMFHVSSIFRARCVYSVAFVVLGFVSSPVSLAAQSQLTLRSVLDSVVEGSPAMRAARMEAMASQEDVSAVERRRWPTVSAIVESYSGNTRSYPSRALQVEQPIWDAGAISAQISEAKASSDISQLKVYLQQQDLFLQIIASWQSILSSRERSSVAQEALVRLREYQSQMRRRVDAEASPRIELDLADSRILQTEVELASAQTSLQIAVTKIEQLTGELRLLGRISSIEPTPTLRATQSFYGEIDRADWFSIAATTPSVAKARIEVVQLKSRLGAKEAEGWPQLFARAYKPIGTIPSSADTSTTVFMGLRYSPGAGFANAVEARAIGTRVGGAEQAADVALREMGQTLQSDSLEFVNSRARIAALEKSVGGSALVLESYKRQFEAGRKSWQDLLNAVRELAQNQYALADARASMAGAMYRLQIRMGREIN